MANENSLSVEIFGQTYKIKGEGDPKALNRVAEYVDSKMHMISDQVATPDPLKIAILTALNIADEYFQAVEQISQMQPGDSSGDTADLDGKVEELSELLDACLED